MSVSVLAVVGRAGTVRGAETEEDFVTCIGRNMGGGGDSVSVINQKDFQDAMFPWFEPRIAPLATTDLEKGRSFLQCMYYVYFVRSVNKCTYERCSNIFLFNNDKRMCPFDIYLYTCLYVCKIKFSLLSQFSGVNKETKDLLFLGCRRTYVCRKIILFISRPSLVKDGANKYYLLGSMN